MPEEPWRQDETERLAALHRLDLLDTAPEPAFERITRLAADLFNVPIALVSLVDADRQWFKSCIGITARETPRDQSFCAQAIQQPHKVMVIPDAAADPRFASNALVTGGPRIRFYAGAPLLGPDGYALGTLCIIDTCPRPPLSPDEARRLVDLAEIVSEQITVRRTIGEMDGVTGLPNRFRLIADLRSWLGAAADGMVAAVPTHVAVVDAVHPTAFTRLVRALGHACGDALAIAAAQHVEAAKPASALRLYHLDGCRFCLPFVAGDTAASQMLEDFAVRLTAAPLVACRGVSVPARPTIGAASLLPSAADHMQAVRAAASAAQSAADAGRGWALHDAGRDAAQQRVFTLLSALDLLLADAAITVNGPFRLVWQPRIELSTGRCVTAEALLRWRHPTLGEVSPGEFIPLAEGTALMPRLTDLVLATALAQMRRWRDAGLGLETASVNISAGDLEDDALAGRVERALAAAGVAPGALELEFTETAAVMEPDRLQRRLAAVRELGVGIALDDFGAGYSNLTYLRRVPATAVKLDRELVATAAHSARDRTVARATASLLRELGLRVVAEGIETEADAATMRDCGCDEGQGYLFSPPLEAEAFEIWLRARDTSSHGAAWTRSAATPNPKPCANGAPFAAHGTLAEPQ